MSSFHYFQRISEFSGCFDIFVEVDCLSTDRFLIKYRIITHMAF